MRAIFSRDKSHLMRSNISSKTLGESKQSFWNRFTWCGGLIRSDRVIGSPPCEPLWVSLSTFRLATAGKTRLESTRSKKCEASAQNVGCTQKCVMPARKCVMPLVRDSIPQKWCWTGGQCTGMMRDAPAFANDALVTSFRKILSTKDSFVFFLQNRRLRV